MPRDFANEQEVQFAAPQVTRSVPIGHQRLLVLAEFLETKVPAKQFDISLFKSGQSLPDLDDCGSAGCALGWCPSVPEFKALGWTWKRSIGGPAPLWQSHINPFNSAADFFEITVEQTWRFFDGHEYGGRRTQPKDVATRIRTFVAEQAREAVACGEAR